MTWPCSPKKRVTPLPDSMAITAGDSDTAADSVHIASQKAFYDLSSPFQYEARCTLPDNKPVSRSNMWLRQLLYWKDHAAGPHSSMRRQSLWWWHRRPVQTVQSYVVRAWFPPGSLDWIYHKNCFLFWQVVFKIHNKDVKINVFCLPCVNCVISFHLDWFWDGFCRLSFMHSRATT